MIKTKRILFVFLIFILGALIIQGNDIIRKKNGFNFHQPEIKKVKMAAGFQFLPPINISDSPETPSRWPDLAFGADALPHVCWQEDYPDTDGADIIYATYDGSQWKLKKITNTPSIKKQHANVEVGKEGTIVVAWAQYQKVTTEDYTIYCRIYSPLTQSWADPVEVSTDWGGDIPMIAVDSQGNIYISWYQNTAGRVASRARINGEWEEIFHHSKDRPRATQTDISIAKDDVVWLVYRVKHTYDDIVKVFYKTYYAKRIPGGTWTEGRRVNEDPQGLSHSHPCICFDIDGTPLVYWQNIDEDVNLDSQIKEIILDENTNPMKTILPWTFLHFPMAAIDIYGNRHLAYQIGPGDSGRGIMYFYKKVNSEKWSNPVLLPKSDGKPKLPNIEADDFGNVGLVWDSSGYPGQKDIFFTSLYPVVPKGLKPPLNLTFSIDVSVISGTVQVIYNLAWEKNPFNNDNNVKSYLIYQKIDDGEYQLLEEVGKDIFSRSIKVTNHTHKYRFAISVISTHDYESDKVEFIPAEN